MDRAMILEHLSLAERHISEGAEHIERQRKLVRELEQDGHNTDEALKLLGQFEELQEMFIKDRESNPGRTR